MLHKDYLLEVIEQFVSSVSQALARALLQRDLEAAEDVEAAVADLVQLDPQTAMALAPESLVTMMLLSGTGDSVAGYAAYALNRLGDSYQNMGEYELAELRRDQANAIAESFGADLNQIPQEFAELEAQLRN
ncbi:MAG: hypothetical protein Q4A07_03095 [Coriobacteriales bacterium]|nr:hypothetical protein [Coriobacteriales bacterium]